MTHRGLYDTCQACWGAIFFVLHDEFVRIRTQRSRGHPNPGYNPGSPYNAGLAPGQAGSDQGEAEIVRALRKLASVFSTMPGQYPLRGEFAPVVHVTYGT